MNSLKIVALTKGAETRKHAALAGAGMWREVGTSWTELRIGIAFNMVGDIGKVPPGGSRFFMGLSSGKDKAMTDADCGHCVGLASYDRAIGAWSDIRWARGLGAASSTGCWYYYLTTTPPSVCCFVTDPWTASTLSSASIGNLGLWGDIDDSTFANYIRVVHWINIQKGSPNFTITECGYPASGGPGGLVSRDDFLSQMDAAVPAFTGHTRLATGWTIAVDEGSNGSLDHVHIMWDQVQPAMYIDALYIGKVS